jgi:DNA replication protein DnaC
LGAAIRGIVVMTAAELDPKERDMLLQQTLDKLNAMRLCGMAEGLKRWSDQAPHNADVSPADLVGTLAESEWLYRENKKLTSRLRKAAFREQACVEDIDYAHPRGLQKQVMLELASCRWVAAKKNVILTGGTGLGKSYLACALGQKACRDGYTVIYRRVSRLFDELARARADGTHAVLLRRLAKTQVLILDDFGPQPLTANERRELMEVYEDRYGISSTVITSQLDPSRWHAVIADETLADGICDRVVHNAHRVKLQGESLRKTKEKGQGLTKPTKSDK